jgi:hypothetical protein
MLQKVGLIGFFIFAVLSAHCQTMEFFPRLKSTGNSIYNNRITDTQDGGYIIGSDVDFINGEFTGNVTKIDATGGLDRSFAHLVFNGQVICIKELEDGKILVAGLVSTS